MQKKCRVSGIISVRNDWVSSTAVAEEVAGARAFVHNTGQTLSSRCFQTKRIKLPRSKTLALCIRCSVIVSFHKWISKISV